MLVVGTMPSHFGWARHDVGQERKEEESGAAGPDNNSDPNTSWVVFCCRTDSYTCDAHDPHWDAQKQQVGRQENIEIQRRNGALLSENGFLSLLVTARCRASASALPLAPPDENGFCLFHPSWKTGASTHSQWW